MVPGSTQARELLEKQRFQSRDRFLLSSGADSLYVRSPSLDPTEHARIRNDLLAYYGRDTLAMVELPRFRDDTSFLYTFTGLHNFTNKR